MQSNKTPPLITIIIAVYNGANTLEACLKSILSQSHKAIELIVMDGGSTDGSTKILEKHSTKITYWESQRDRGIYHAWNKALTHASGEWIYFLGADDLLHDEFVLERFCAHIKNLEVRPLIAYGKIIYCDGNNRRPMGEPWSAISRKIHRGMCIPHQGVFHNKNLFSKYGPFDETFKIAGDYKTILKSIKESSPYFISDLIVAYQYSGGKSSLRKFRWQVLKEFRRAQQSEGIPVSWHWYLAYVKACAWRLLK